MGSLVLAFVFIKAGDAAPFDVGGLIPSTQEGWKQKVTDTVVAGAIVKGAGYVTNNQGLKDKGSAIIGAGLAKGAAAHLFPKTCKKDQLNQNLTTTIEINEKCPTFSLFTK